MLHARDTQDVRRGLARRDAKKYKSDAKAADTLAAKVVKGGSGVWGPIPMSPNKVSDDEAKKLVA